MPCGDGTGPLGKGPRTGRQMGRCAGAQGGSQLGAIFCRRGAGWRGAYAALSTEEQVKVLEAELNSLEEERKRIEQRIKELKG